MKPSELAEVIKVAAKINENLLIKGAPGIGKTDIIKKALADIGANLIISHPVTSDPTDYKGLPFSFSKGGKQWAEFLAFGDLLKLINADELTYFFLDDLIQAPTSVQAAAMQLLQGGQINGHKISKHVRFIAATNRKQDRAGGTSIIEPVKSRFTIVELETNLEDWLTWYFESPYKDMVEPAAFLRYRPELLHQFKFDEKAAKESGKKAQAEMENMPCPRTWEKLSNWLHKVSSSVEYEVYEGCIGEGAAAEFTGFLKIYRNLPDPDLILQNPKKAEIPQDMATLYALCGALSHRANEKNMVKIVDYANRLSNKKEFNDGMARTEFSVFMIRDAVRKDMEVTKTNAFIQWATAHQEVLC